MIGSAILGMTIKLLIESAKKDETPVRGDCLEGVRRQWQEFTVEAEQVNGRDQCIGEMIGGSEGNEGSNELTFIQVMKNWNFNGSPSLFCAFCQIRKLKLLTGTKPNVSG